MSAGGCLEGVCLPLVHGCAGRRGSGRQLRRTNKYDPTTIRRAATRARKTTRQPVAHPVWAEPVAVQSQGHPALAVVEPPVLVGRVSWMHRLSRRPVARPAPPAARPPAPPSRSALSRASGSPRRPARLPARPAPAQACAAPPRSTVAPTRPPRPAATPAVAGRPHALPECVQRAGRLHRRLQARHEALLGRRRPDSRDLQRERRLGRGRALPEPLLQRLLRRLVSSRHQALRRQPGRRDLQPHGHLGTRRSTVPEHLHRQRRMRRHLPTRDQAVRGLVRQECDAAGTWKDMGSACPNICRDGACAGMCSPGIGRCNPNGGAVQTCATDASGWTDTETCNGNFACVSGACSTTQCRSNFTRCGNDCIPTACVAAPRLLREL